MRFLHSRKKALASSDVSACAAKAYLKVALCINTSSPLKRELADKSMNCFAFLKFFCCWYQRPIHAVRILPWASSIE